ncbi:hypothetical protein, partial [Pseudomonas proteolytica]|uniref:hypothetical protein n=1 Tax=Pseudomonas proteolytica TaxID=219574 RepID=UPI001CA4221A
NEAAQKALHVSSDKPRWPGLGLLRSPARAMRRPDKPARHNCAICLDLGVAAKLCRYRCSDDASKNTPERQVSDLILNDHHRRADAYKT